MKYIAAAIAFVGSLVAVLVFIAVTKKDDVQQVETVSEVVDLAQQVDDEKFETKPVSTTELAESVPIEESPIPEGILSRIKATAAESHPENYSTQLFVIKIQSKAYRELEAFSRPDDIPENVYKAIIF